MSLHGICTFIWQNEKSGFYNMNKQNYNNIVNSLIVL